MHWPSLVAMAFGAVVAYADAESNRIHQFDPHQYEQHERNAQCPAILRGAEGDSVVDINISESHAGESATLSKTSRVVDYVDIQPSTNPKETLVLVHGWPGMWSTWGRQIVHFQVSCAEPSSSDRRNVAALLAYLVGVSRAITASLSPIFAASTNRLIREMCAQGVLIPTLSLTWSA